MTTTRTYLGITFTSNCIDVNNSRPSDLLTIAFSSMGNETSDTNSKMAKEIKKVSDKIEIVKHPKYFQLTTTLEKC